MIIRNYASGQEFLDFETPACGRQGRPMTPAYRRTGMTEAAQNLALTLIFIRLRQLLVLLRIYIKFYHHNRFQIQAF